MNYIKQLQAENIEKAKEIERINQIILDLKVYLSLGKFTADYESELFNYVNIKDVLQRIGEI